MGCGSSVAKINGDNLKEIRSTDKKNDKIDERTIKQLSTQENREADSTDYQRKEDKLEDEKTSETKQENNHEADGNSENISDHPKTENDQENSITEIKKESEKLPQSGDVGEYSAIDAHARRAPSSVGNSVEDLVSYMLSFSKEPKILVRGFFIWIAENIRYDVVGFFNDKKGAPCDTMSVMTNKICVCQGYANVLTDLCSKANIPVVTVIGYTKDQIRNISFLPFLAPVLPDHVWNAVQLDGNWYLIDNTWGSGYLDENKTYNKKLNEFYFLAEPKHLISTHFPCMPFTAFTNFFGPSLEHTMYFEQKCEESKRWQLLSEPINLEQFHKNVMNEPEAFKLGFEAVSHQHEHIDMENEIKMQFKTTQPEDIIVEAYIMRNEGAKFVEEPNATFVVPGQGIVNILVHPRAVGDYMLKIFGNFICDDSDIELSEIMRYYIYCTQVNEKNFEFPRTLAAAGREKVVLHEPRRGNLIEESTVHFRLSTPYLQRIKVGDTYLNKEADLFTGDVTVNSTNQLIVSGSRQNDKQILDNTLYIFKICQQKQQQTRQPIISKTRKNTRRAR